ncbi:MAG: response regulator [Proteobacteria bacterium]|nr:response regulator [Pseudomonadota bacterium]MBU1687154.1 response regulator [Pseudomonadota bacterium]
MRLSASKRCIPIVLTLLLMTACSGGSLSPSVHDGTLDLASWDFVHSSLELSGDWRFYWSQLLTPDDFQQKSQPKETGLIHLPGNWNDYQMDGRSLGPFGAATYRLTIRLPESTEPLAIRLNSISTAYRMWANGVLVGERGRVGLSEETSVADLQHDIHSLPGTDQTMELVLQVANFHLQQGGVPHAILLGRESELKSRLIRDQAYDLLVAGGLILLGLFFLSRYFVGRVILGRADTGAFWFSSVCLTWGAHGLFFGVSGHPILRIWEMGWEPFCKLDFIIFYLSVPALTVLFSTLFPQESVPRLNRVWLGAALFFSLPVLLTDSHLYSRVMYTYEYWGLLQMVYVLWFLVRALLRRREGARPIMAGMAVLSIASVNDVLLSTGVIDTVFLTPFGILALVLSQAHTLSLRSVRATQKVERLSCELEEKNIALKRGDQLKDEFLANTSHELRTPLNGIIGLAESMRDTVGEGAAQRRRDLDLIASSGRRLANLVNDILDFSRLKNRDLELNLASVDLHGAVSTVMAFCAPLVGAKALTLHNDVSADLPPVRADEDRLQQILYNLLGNAIKFTEHGEVRIQADLDHDQVKISVRDSGVGIAPEFQESIFNSFEQVDGSASRYHGGTGLGLGISRQLVELHGGHLDLESTPGHGSVFHFCLPISKEGTDSLPTAIMAEVHSRFIEVQPFVPERFETGGLVGQRVLVVDDDPVNLQVAINHLAAQGLAVTPVGGGAEALALLEGGSRFDLVLLDIMMPGISGFEVCRRLRHRYTSVELPVIMLTAKNRLADLVEGLALGANDYLTKPFAREELLARTRAQLQVRQAHLALEENRLLKNALSQREQALGDAQARLAGILDRLKQPLLVMNRGGEILLGNRQLEQWLGYGKETLLGQPLTLLFSEETAGRLQSILVDLIAQGDGLLTTDADQDISLIPGIPVNSMAQGRVTATLQPTLFELDDEQQLLLLVYPEQVSPMEVADPVLLVESLQGSPAEPELPQDQRALMVAVMNRTLDLWVHQTSTSKVELARRSGLWSVYMDRDGWERTQTLDRYLELATLPKHPRRKVVFRTAEYVLQECPGQGNEHLELRQLLDRMRQTA